MNHYEKLIADEILSVQGQKDYCVSVLATGGLESWASKEYSDLIEQYDRTLTALNERLKSKTWEEGINAHRIRNWAGNPFEVGSQEQRDWDWGYSNAECGIH